MIFGSPTWCSAALRHTARRLLTLLADVDEVDMEVLVAGEQAGNRLLLVDSIVIGDQIDLLFPGLM
jgi:hypothetical protein